MGNNVLKIRKKKTNQTFVLMMVAWCRFNCENNVLYCYITVLGYCVHPSTVKLNYSCSQVPINYSP